MKNKELSLRVLLFLGIVLWPFPGGALAPEKACALHTLRHERLKGIPRHLLASISKVESGRYDHATQEIIAWPWTINAEGKGFRYDTKYEAVAAVKKLQSQGVKSIDVGCMQVNLHHHKNAFKTLEDAFDPRKNVDYAAQFLSGLKDTHKSWTKAVAHYHSATPEHHRPYRKKVYDTWRAEQRNDTQKAQNTPYTQLAMLRSRAQAQAHLSGQISREVGDQGAGFSSPITSLDRRAPRDRRWTSQLQKKSPLAAYRARAQNTVLRLKQRRGAGGVTSSAAPSSPASPTPASDSAFMLANQNKTPQEALDDTLGPEQLGPQAMKQEAQTLAEGVQDSSREPRERVREVPARPFPEKRYASIRARARKLLNLTHKTTP